jgi:hypothetical protein
VVVNSDVAYGSYLSSRFVGNRMYQRVDASHFTSEPMRTLSSSAP